MRIFGGIGAPQARFAHTLTGGVPLFNAYYLSSSGSDLNDGRTPATAWRTLAKAQTRLWQPGDTLFLKRGDAWTEPFFPAGSGAFDTTTYANTYASTYTSALASYLAGTAYSVLYADLIASGYNSTIADTYATRYCQRLANADAMIAARNAAQASSQWITMAAYGTGARPKIAPGAANSNSAIEFTRDGSWTGGWKFVSLDIRDAACAGIDAEMPTLHAAHGMWITDCFITNITGMPVPSGPPAYPSLVPHYIQFDACGLEFTGTDHVFIDTTYITECDQPWWLGTMTDCVIDYCFPSNSLRESTYFSSASNVLVRNSKVSEMCYFYGFWAGCAGNLLGDANNITFLICDLGTTRTPPGTGDGMSVDYESHCVNCSILNCVIHDNSGEGMMKFENPILSPPTDSGTVIVDTNFYTNGYRGPSLIANTLRYEDTSTDAILWARCQMRKSSAAQKLFGKHSRASGTTTLTDTPDPLWIYANSNVVVA